MQIKQRLVVISGLLILFILAAFCLLELSFQLHSFCVLDYKNHKTKNSPRHYYEKSKNKVLGYELKRNYYYKHSNGMDIKINKYGIREKSNEVFKEKKVALLGDSVVFGVTHAQGDNIAGILQQRLNIFGKNIKTLNLSVGGYYIEQVFEFLKYKNKIYDINNAIYILNPNDFSLKNSIYEGADNGLYRMYQKPFFKTKWYIGKGIYRINKKYPDWYKWTFRGNKIRGFNALKNIVLYTQRKNIDYTVVLLPVGSAYKDNTYELSEMSDEIKCFLKEYNISTIDPVNIFLNHRKNCMTAQITSITKENY